MNRALIIACAVGTFAASVAVADDLVPAPFRDFQNPYYTIQEWEFNHPNLPLPPDGDTVPFINPGQAALVIADNVQWTSTGGIGDLTGYIGGEGGGSLWFDIDNVVDEEPLKEIWIQINGVWDATPPPFVVQVEAFKFDGETDVAVPSFFVESAEAPFPGFHRWELWYAMPNPDFEIIQVFVPEGTFVNQVVIETISHPEPASLALLSLGGLALMRRR